MTLLSAHRILMGSALLVSGTNAALDLVGWAGGDSSARAGAVGWTLAAAAVGFYWRWIRSRRGSPTPLP